MTGGALDLFKSVVNVHWGGVIAQLSISNFDDYNPVIYFGADQSIEAADGTTIKWEDIKDFRDSAILMERGLEDIQAEFIQGQHFYNVLVNLPGDTVGEVSVGEQYGGESYVGPWPGAQLQARLQIFPTDTIFTAVWGDVGNPHPETRNQPSELVADREPSYDKTKVHQFSSQNTPVKYWEFNREGWLDDDDIGTYLGLQKRPTPPPDAGGGGSFSVLSRVSSSLLVAGEWRGCVHEIEGVTGVSIEPPASHVDGTGIITTGASAFVAISVDYIPDAEGGEVADCECAILEVGTLAILATGDNDCSVVFSGQVMAAARIKTGDADTIADATLTVVSPPPSDV